MENTSLSQESLNFSFTPQKLSNYHASYFTAFSVKLKKHILVCHSTVRCSISVWQFAELNPKHLVPVRLGIVSRLIKVFMQKFLQSTY